MIKQKRGIMMLSNFHTHTIRCQHASGTDREYVEAAIQAGFKILGFSDHCPWPFPDGYVSNIRMAPAEIDGYFSAMDAIKKEYASDIKIYTGFEAEYTPALNAAQEAILSGYPIDYMILGQHFLGSESESVFVGRPFHEEARLKHYVDLTIEAVDTGKYLYLAHPDIINYIGSDKIYEKHISRLCQFMKEKDFPLEVNVLGLWGGRTYPDRRFWEIAAKIGCTAVIGIDAHSPEQLLNSTAVKQAEAFCEEFALNRIEVQL